MSKIECKQATILQFYLTNEMGEWLCWGNLMSVAVGVYSLFQVYTTTANRKQGLGTKLIEQVKTWADKHEVLVQMEVNGWGEKGLNNEQLFKWYSDLGFQYQTASNGRIYMQYQGKKQ